uniref:Uncharacterized protein n=1 Tax=Meloidogyne enterolobii TaxID=390850 RepID=A0A6V7VTY0_MELEN|nr:unnamed protein product [Meloidogyne enterolobii]
MYVVTRYLPYLKDLESTSLLMLHEPVNVLFTQALISGGLSNMNCIDKSPFYPTFCLTTCNHFLIELDNEIAELNCFNFINLKIELRQILDLLLS